MEVKAFRSTRRARCARWRQSPEKMFAYEHVDANPLRDNTGSGHATNRVCLIKSAIVEPGRLSANVGENSPAASIPVAMHAKMIVAAR